MELKKRNEREAYFAGKTFAYKDLIKAIPGTVFDKVTKVWYMPLESLPDAKRIFPSLQMDAEIQQLFSAMQARHAAAVATKKVDFRTLDVQDVPGLTGQLRKYQQYGMNFLAAIGHMEGSVLAFDMGTGKSITMLAYFLWLRAQGIVDRALVVCPSPLKYATWAKEIQKFTTLGYTVIDGDRSVEVTWDDGVTEKLDGRDLRAVQYQQWDFGSDIIVMNYELFMHDADKDHYTFEQELTPLNLSILHYTAKMHNITAGRKEDSPTGYKHAIAELLPQIVYHPAEYGIRKHKGEYALFRRSDRNSILPKIDDRVLVIMDEAHRIKNPNSVMTKNLINHLRPAGRKVLGTGTPLENAVEELYALMDFCRPGLLGTFYQFKNRYIETDYFGSIIGPKVHMMDELRNKIAPVMLRLTKAEALPELPPIERVDYGVGMTTVQKALYAQIKEGMLLDAQTGDFTYMDAIVQITRLQQVLDSPALLRELMNDPTLPVESGKLNELRGIISDIDPARNQFLLFSQYSQMTDILHEWLTAPDEKGQSILDASEVGYVKGGISPLQIEKVRSDFQEGKLRCVLMTTAGNYGLDLYKASYAICYDNLFNPQKMEQFLARGHRSGNTTGLTAITLTTNNSFEERKQQILERKREIFRAMIDEDDLAFAKLFTMDELMSLI